MKKEELIIKLLVEDLKFHQMTIALKPLKLSHDHALDIVSIVARLMISSKSPSDDWLNIYTSYMNRADECHFWNDMALSTMAQACYNELREV